MTHCIVEFSGDRKPAVSVSVSVIKLDKVSLGKNILTDRLRSTTVRYCFHSWGGGGGTQSSRGGGYSG